MPKSKTTESQPEKPQRVRATFHLPIDVVVAIDTMQTEQLKKTGKKPERSQIVSEAVLLFLKQKTANP